jgi:hypothetical protein
MVLSDVLLVFAVMALAGLSWRTACPVRAAVAVEDADDRPQRALG